MSGKDWVIQLVSYWGDGVRVNELEELRTNKGAELQKQQRNWWEPGPELPDSRVFGSPAGFSGAVLGPTPRS